MWIFCDYLILLEPVLRNGYPRDCPGVGTNKTTDLAFLCCGTLNVGESDERGFSCIVMLALVRRLLLHVLLTLVCQCRAGIPIFLHVLLALVCQRRAGI